MRILFLSPRQNWPPVTGAKLREYFLARSLGEASELTLIFFNRPGMPAPQAEDLPFCHRILAVPQPRGYTALKLIQGLLSRWPISVLNYSSPRMAQVLEKILHEESFDLIHIDSIHMAGYFDLIKRRSKAQVVFNWHNIESELMSRYIAAADSVARRLYARVTLHRLEQLELELLQNSFGHIVCSEREHEKLHTLVPQARIAVIGNGVDIDSFEKSQSDATTRDRLVFVGSMDYHANVEAVRWFAAVVWPLLRASHPGWRLTIVGSNPTPAVLALRDGEGIEVTGTVSDVRPWYQQAIAAIVPLRTGGGTRLKILEAMAAGVPVVSTRLGAEGLEVQPDLNILIANEPDEWMRQLQKLSGPGNARGDLVREGWILVRSRYDWRSLGMALCSTYEAWLRPEKTGGTNLPR